MLLGAADPERDGLSLASHGRVHVDELQHQAGHIRQPEEYEKVVQLSPELPLVRNTLR